MKMFKNLRKVVSTKYSFQSRLLHDITGDVLCPNSIRGIDCLKDPRLNKGLAFTFEERQSLGILGLLAAKIVTQADQLAICKLSLDRYQNDLNKYLYLSELQDTNLRLFYLLLESDIEKYMPIIYTPTVGVACQRFGLVYRRPRGLFVTIHDKGHVFEILRNWPESDVRAICMTDGERILGLGDLGAYGMGIPVGKLSLYTALAGIKPHQCLPVTIDVGTENKELQSDPLYIGLRQPRVRGQPYFELMDEFMEACVQRFGPNVLLQFEDFALPNAQPLLARYQDKYCTFNDDIQGTASVAVAGMLAATRITKNKISQNIILFFGAGSAANGIADLTVYGMMQEGVSEKEACDRIYMFDIDGLVTTRRKGGVPEHCKRYSKDVEAVSNFADAVSQLKATCIIGCSTVGGAFNEQVLGNVAKNCPRPIVFALSNPTSRAECSAQAAYDHTGGKCVFASGSPFPTVKYDGKEYKTGQGNNSYIFPGLALGVIATSAHSIPTAMFYEAAKTVANFVSEEDLAIGRIYPPLSDLRKVSLKIAEAISIMAYKQDLATRWPKPADIVKHIKSQQYDLNYLSYIPTLYAYPEMPNIRVKSIEEAHPINPVKKGSKT